MSKAITYVACALLLSLWAIMASAAERKTLYKWVDEKGVVHYGDSIPPQYAKQERRVLNQRGVEVGRLEAEKSEAERSAETAKLQAAAKVRQRDQILLATYGSVAQIEDLRDQRLELIESQVRVTNQYIDTLQNRLRQLHARSQFFRPYSSSPDAKPMPDTFAEDLVRAVNEMRVQERNLAAKRSDQDELRREFQADIERFRELKGLR